ncbi:recombinase family protein [Oscillibacter sp.]|uniref:recombinase family protein n=1 Tax=Oscillibacter sp. TaxID=1945593 RepID=UPI0033961094
MKAVIYARFSSDRQREESIDGQIRECTEYAKRNNIDLVGSYIDRALSASKETEKRLDFMRMVRDSSKHLFDVVLVWKLDRFSRDRYDAAHYKHILKKNGVKVVSATEHIADGPEGIILESMLEGMAEYYSAELSEKIHRGQKENALKGRCNGGRIPFGYRLNTEHKLEVDPFTAPVVKEVFRRYADGETVRLIVDSLKERGIKTRMGCDFTYSSFGTLLKNRTYVGEYHYDGTVISDGVPAIVEQNIFDRVQTRREKNKLAPAATKADEQYLLTTKLFCGICGTMMAGESGTGTMGKTYRYYKCSHAKRKKGCTKKAVKKEWIENLVVQQTMNIVMDDMLLDRITDRLVELQGEENYSLKLLEKQKAEVEKGIENMLNAIQAGIIAKSTKNRLAELEAQKEQFEQDILREEMQRPILTREQISFFLYQFRKTDIQDKEQRQRLIDSFVNAVYVFDDKIVLTFNYKNGTKTISLEEVNSSDLDSFAPPKKP